MSLGVIPIVLNNDVEKTIVKDKENGILIKDLNNFYEETKFILKNKNFKKISKIPYILQTKIIQLIK